MKAMSLDFARVIRLAWSYYNEHDNITGGSLHIVLDDGNFEEHHTRWCIDYARENNDTKGVILGEALLTLTDAERKSLFEDHYGRYRWGAPRPVIDIVVIDDVREKPFTKEEREQLKVWFEDMRRITKP